MAAPSAAPRQAVWNPGWEEDMRFGFYRFQRTWTGTMYFWGGGCSTVVGAELENNKHELNFAFKERHGAMAMEKWLSRPKKEID